MRRIIVLLLAAQITFGCTINTGIWTLPPKADPLFRFERRGKPDDKPKIGFIDTKGNVVVKPSEKLYSADAFFSGILLLPGSDALLLDSKGKSITFEGFDRVWNFHEGLAQAVHTFGTSLWGYIDRSGSWAISPRFACCTAERMSDFSEGFAAIETNGKVGYINRSGDFAIAPQFADGGDFSEGMALVAVAGPCAYLLKFDCYGESAILPYSRYGTLDVRNLPECRWSFVDTSGHVLSAEFEDALDFHDGLAAVKKNGKWGYIDKSGSFIIQPRFLSTESFSEGMARVRDADTSGYIDRSGKIQFTAKYGGSFSAGRVFVGDREQGYIYVDKQGHQLIKERFAFASDFRYGVAHVALWNRDGTFAYINLKGKHVFTYRGFK